MTHRIIFYIFLILSVVSAATFAFSPTPTNYIHIHKLSSSSNIIQRYDTSVNASIKQRLTFNSPPLQNGKDPPKLILISGCPGTGELYICIIIFDIRYARNMLLLLAYVTSNYMHSEDKALTVFAHICSVLVVIDMLQKLFTYHLPLLHIFR